MNLKQGTLLQGGRYRIEKVLGQGGFGITYLAEQTSLNDKVAIKEFFMKELCDRDSKTMGVSVGSSGSRELVDRFREKFIKEARNIRKLKHRNIVSIIDVFEENGTAYYVMEYLDGGNLKSLVDNRGPLAEVTAVSYIRQVTDALGEVHANGMLHLDVKPANIMLDRRGNAVLIDFGISKHYDEGGSQTSSGLTGTSEGYAPLEQYEAASLKTFTPATDIYALGATLFFLLTGQRPPKASDVMNLGLPALPSKVSSCVRKAVEDAMNPVVRMRPQSISEFLKLLDSAGGSVSVKPIDIGEALVAKEESTVIEAPIVEPLSKEPQSVASAQVREEKVKWMDFAEFKDAHRSVVAWMRFKTVLVCLLFTNPSIVFVFPVVIYYFCNRAYLRVIKDIEDTGSIFKIVRGENMYMGLTRWREKGARSLLRIKYDNISRINEDTFICTRNRLSGVYNATKRKMVVPVKCESIEVKDNRIHATRDGVVAVYTDHGYRVVE